MADTTPRKKIPDALRINPGDTVKLTDDNADRVLGWTKDTASPVFEENRTKLEALQYKMYADRRCAMLVVLQAIDAGGKDGTIRHVFTAFNPQGCTVTSFKAPTSQELSHDFLWRIHQKTPPKGEIGVFNRSHYEDVIVVRVDNLAPKEVWSRRYDQINEFERMLSESGTSVVKIFLQISRDEQKSRLQDRLKDPDKHWKFDPADLDKRAQWNDYRKAFEAAISRCTTKVAPWYVVPANHKWFRNLAVSQILRTELEKLPLAFPTPTFDPRKVRIR